MLVLEGWMETPVLILLLNLQDTTLQDATSQGTVAAARLNDVTIWD